MDDVYWCLKALVSGRSFWNSSFKAGARWGSWWLWVCETQHAMLFIIIIMLHAMLLAVVRTTSGRLQYAGCL
jgi:hypothetical protein